MANAYKVLGQLADASANNVTLYTCILYTTNAADAGEN